MPKFLNIENLKQSILPASYLAGGWALSSGAPKVIGYLSDPNEERRKLDLALSAGLGAAGDAVTWNPDKVLPEFAKNKLNDYISPKSYQKIIKYAPIIGGTYGLASGWGSYEMGRAAKKQVNKVTDKSEKKAEYVFNKIK